MHRHVPFLAGGLFTFVICGALISTNLSAQERPLEVEDLHTPVRDLWRKHTLSPADNSIQQQLLATTSALDVLINLLYDERSAKAAAWPATEAERTQLQVAATALLDIRWPSDQLRSAARRNLKLLSQVEIIPFRWDERPIVPLLASLRHSLDPVDRDLLSWFAESARDAPAELALQLMPHGYRGNIRNQLAAHWKNLPQHDYSQTYWKCLDPDRPKTLMQAAHLLPNGKQRSERLDQLLDQPLKPETRHKLCSLLFYSSKKAREYFIDRLTSEDEATFQEAVNRLTGNWGYGDARPLVPRLKLILDGHNEQRRKTVLKRMGGLRGPGAQLVAEAVAPHLLAKDWRERGLAAEALLRLEHGEVHHPERNQVLRKVSEKTDDRRIQELCQELIKAPNQTLKKLSGHLVAPPATPSPDVTVARRLELVSAWRKWSQQSSAQPQQRDSTTKTQLLEAGEAALEVLLDLALGPSKQLTDDQVEELVHQLGSNEFARREAASEELLASGEVIRTRLEKHVDHNDAEVRARITRLLAQLNNPKWTDYELDQLRRAATAILIRDWPLDQQRAVTKRHLDRLAKIKSVPHHVTLRPVQVLLASLRYSEVPADRDLLAELSMKAEPGAAQMCLTVMRNGINGYEGMDMYSDWRRVPYYDYKELYWEFLDPARPELFTSAINHIEDKQRLAIRLREVLKEPLADSLKDSVHGYLWHVHGDLDSAEYYVAQLRSDDDQVFQGALIRLTDSDHSYRGLAVIPKLLPTLQGDDDHRRLQVLERLGGYLGEPSVTLAADTVAPFLASRYSDEREAAEKALLQLQESRWVDVLKRVSEKGPSQPVREAAAKLQLKWSSAKPNQRENE